MLCCKCQPLVQVSTAADWNNAALHHDYAIVVQGRSCPCVTGRQAYDFQDGTVSFFHCEDGLEELPKELHSRSTVLSFSHKLFECAPNVCELANYTFFEYAYSESLQVSDKEKAALRKCISDVGEEIDWGVDKYTYLLIAEKIKILLDLCQRFYDRQHITRTDVNMGVMEAINKTIDAYILSPKDPCVFCNATLARQFAGQHGMSTTYFQDFLRQETGMEVANYVRLRQMKKAKWLLATTQLPVCEIAKTLGFTSSQCFSSLFAKLMGAAPTEYRERHRAQ